MLDAEVILRLRNIYKKTGSLVLCFIDPGASMCIRYVKLTETLSYKYTFILPNGIQHVVIPTKSPNIKYGIEACTFLYKRTKDTICKNIADVLAEHSVYMNQSNAIFIENQYTRPMLVTFGIIYGIVSFITIKSNIEIIKLAASSSERMALLTQYKINTTHSKKDQYKSNKNAVIAVAKDIATISGESIANLPCKKLDDMCDLIIYSTIATSDIMRDL